MRSIRASLCPYHVGTERKDSAHHRRRFMEETHPLGGDHHRCQRKTTAALSAVDCRKYEQGRSTVVSQEPQAASAREETAPHLGRATRASCRSGHCLGEDTATLAPYRALSRLCPGAEPHRISVGSHEEEASRQPWRKSVQARQGTQAKQGTNPRPCTITWLSSGKSIVLTYVGEVSRCGKNEKDLGELGRLRYIRTGEKVCGVCARYHQNNE